MTDAGPNPPFWRAEGADKKTLRSVTSIRHGFFGRRGGISTDALSSLNLGTAQGDLDQNILTNQQRIMAALNAPTAAFVGINQVHQDTVWADVDGDSPRPSADAMWTNRSNVALAIKTADCLPLLMASDDARIMAAAHLGWRGSVMGLGQKLVRSLREQAHLSPQRLIAELGPAIGPCCFEVGADVVARVEGMVEVSERSRVIIERNHTTYLNLWALNRLELLAAGLLAEHIHAVEMCTFCASDALFSYRRDQGQTGRQVSVIVRPIL